MTRTKGNTPATHGVKVSTEVYLCLVRKMRGRETFDDALRRVLHLPPVRRPWLEDALAEKTETAEE